MKIAIVSYYFDPEITPRSFRTTEIVNELLVQGHEVTVFLPKREIPILKHDNLKYEIVSELYDLKSKYILSNMFKFFGKTFGLKWCNFVYYVSERLKLVEYDKIISIALPIYTHASVALYVNNYSYFGVTIADYGDPYSYASNIRLRKIKQTFEKWILSKFDYIIIPTINAVPIFKNFKPESKIKVIPQALNFSNLLIESDEKYMNSIVTFSYAGNFYPNIRDPFELLYYLTNENINYKFVIYTDINFTESYRLIEEFVKNSNEKIVVKNMVNRKECILELSKCDFLVNIDNIENKQVPSKLIDYKLSGRPVFNYQPGKFDSEVFDKFLKGDYSLDAVKTFDLARYDITKAITKILELK